jgi:outer membrane protein TolC
MWPSANYGQLGYASRPTWSAGFEIEWRIFDGGARKNQLAAAESSRREAQDEMTDKRDQATREVWSSYIAFRTAIRKRGGRGSAARVRERILFVVFRCL